MQRSNGFEPQAMNGAGLTLYGFLSPNEEVTGLLIKLSTQNLDYARTLLLRLEQDTATIKIQSKKQEAQTELLQKRNIIQQLSERLQELEHVCQHKSLYIPSLTAIVRK